MLLILIKALMPNLYSFFLENRKNIFPDFQDVEITHIPLKICHSFREIDYN